MRGYPDAAIWVLGQFGRHIALPQRFAGIQIDAHQMSHQIVHVARVFAIQSVTGIARHEHLAIDHDRAGHARPGQRGFPSHVRLGRPPQRNRRIRLGNPQTTRPPKPRPIVRNGRPARHRRGNGQTDPRQIEAPRTDPPRRHRIVQRHPPTPKTFDPNTRHPTPSPQRATSYQFAPRPMASRSETQKRGSGRHARKSETRTPENVFGES